MNSLLAQLNTIRIFLQKYVIQVAMITLFGERETIEDMAKFQLVIFKSSSVIINKQVGNMLLFIQKMGSKKYDRGLETL